MQIRNVRHKALERWITERKSKGLPAQYLQKIDDIVALLDAIEDCSALARDKTYGNHELSGDRKGTFAFVVSRNWRLTVRCDPDEDELYDLDFEDYH